MPAVLGLDLKNPQKVSNSQKSLALATGIYLVLIFVFGFLYFSQQEKK